MKLFIGALVGGIIIFICQFLSWGILDFHRPAQQYTPKQDSILNYLSTHFDSSGGYMLPNTPKGASSKDMESLAETHKDKPWAQVYYHTKLNTNMGINMLKNLVINVLMVLFFCWIISGYASNNFGKIFLASLLTGLIIFLHASYTEHIWYETFDLEAHFFDYMFSWGATGIWLGWWLNKKKV